MLRVQRPLENEISGDQARLIVTLSTCGFEEEIYYHTPVYTCDEAREELKDLPGVATKNLFLRDRKKKNWLLLTVLEDQEVRLNAIGALLGLGRLSLASEEDLFALLRVPAGAVSPLALINDSANCVQFYLEEKILESPLQMHLLSNDRTAVIFPTVRRGLWSALGRKEASIVLDDCAPEIKKT